jgi:outer membrane protein assembly factor BamD
MRVSSSIAAPLLIALLLFGCSSASKNKPAADQTNPRPADADEQVLKQNPLERNYDPHVIMKRAEAFYEKEDYAEAAVEYQHFLDLHKTHVLAPYAQYRLGLSHFNLVTARDRDPEPVRQTLDALEKLLREYPGNAYEADARAKIKECRNHIAAYELYVGRHYYRKAAYLAALHRFEGVMTKYPDSDAAAEAQYYIALTYRDIGDKDRAVDYLTGFVQQFPKSPLTQESKFLLAQLTGKPFKNSVVSNGVASNGTLPNGAGSNGISRNGHAPALQPGKASLPPPLPTTTVSAASTTTLPPDGMNGTASQVVNCSLNVMC